MEKYPEIKSIYIALPVSCFREIAEKLPVTKEEMMQIDQVSIFFLTTLQKASGLYYKHITITNDGSRVIRMTLQVVASPMIFILTSLDRGVIYTPREH
jgi:hypothetical protein